MPDWSFTHKNGIKLITVPAWDRIGIIMGFTTRCGGVSSGAYATLNLGLHVGDQPDRVLENRRRLLAGFDSDLHEAVCCQQVHGDKVAKVAAGDKGRGALDLETAIPDCDAMITNEPNLWLLSFYADCVPVYFVDPVHRAVGLAHCGWKGTMGRLASKTLRHMQAAYRTAPEQVQVFIGPGIGPCCFVIQPDLKDKVQAEFSGWHDIMTGGTNGSVTWDLQETNRRLLLADGVSAVNIRICKICTACNTGIFFSHRKEKGITGRMGALLGIRY